MGGSGRAGTAGSSTAGSGAAGAGTITAGTVGAGIAGSGTAAGAAGSPSAGMAAAAGMVGAQAGGGSSAAGAPSAGGVSGAAGTASGGVSGSSGGVGGAVSPPACTGAPVKATQSGTRFTLDNGLVKATVETSNATVPSFVFKGVETMQTGGYFSWGTNTYTAGPFKGGLSADPATNNGEVAEVFMTTKYSGAAGVVPLDLEVRFALPRCSQGLYEYVVLTHPTSYPAFSPGEMRVNHYIKLDMFDWFAVDDTRRGPFLSQADETASQAVAGAPVEVRKYVSGPFADRPGWQKYDATIEWGEGNVYGWSSTANKIGLWIINPSNEYLPGGPMKTELTVHPGGSGRGALLNYWGGSHFYGKLEAVQANQQREKVLGPWLLYANATTLAGAAGHDQLWADAKQRLIWEKAAWPYAWERDPRYPAKAARGTVQGKLVFSDPEQPLASIANAWVGLARPPVAGAPSFEHQGWDYQYWVRADAQGNFTIANVRPGSYTLHAFAPGIHGVHMGQANGVTVAAGAPLSLGTVTWAPDRRGATVWEIGIPDRTPKEFRRGDQAWHYGTHLLFSRDFPNGVSYAVGTSTPAMNWNYLQPGGTWNVTFNIASIPATASAASLVLDVAGSDGASVRASVNGTQVGSGNFPYDDGAIDRDQPHGVLQSARIEVPLTQLRTGANTLALTATGRFMWDYLRLEWVTR